MPSIGVPVEGIPLSGYDVRRPELVASASGHLPHRADGHRLRTAGGFGLKLALSNPILLDAVAADFPELQVIMAHPSVPWQEEAIAVATHKANVWIDLSGWSPKDFPEILVLQANSVLQNKVLFCSDFPLISPDRWMNDFANHTIKDQVRPKIIKDNAVRLVGLNPQAAS